MLFNLPPIFGLIPLLLFIVLAFAKKSHSVFNGLVCFVLAAILTKTPFITLGKMIQDSLGGTMGLTGFIMLLASGLGAVLQKTGAAEEIVYFFVKVIGVNTKTKATLVVMIVSSVLTAMLGTLTGALAIISPIVIPLVAAVGLTPATLGVLFQGAGLTGMWYLPYNVNVTHLLGLVDMTFGEYLLKIGLPITIVVLVVVFFISKKINRESEGQEHFSFEGNVDVENHTAKPGAVRSALTFIAVMVILVVISFIYKTKSDFIIIMMLASASATAIAGRMSIKDACVTFTKGMAPMCYLFLNFVVFTPFLSMVSSTGCFAVIADVLQPVIAKAGRLGFAVISFVIGVFGISGAVPVQQEILNGILAPIATGMNISKAAYTMAIMIGARITNFAYPAGQMIAIMGLSQTMDVKSMMKSAYLAVIPATLAVLIIGVLVL